MPTAESAAFLAKKPTVAPTYEGVDFEDNVAVHNARDAIIREQWVRSMMARLVGEELGKCYAREGVNHLEKCGVLRGKTVPNPEGVTLDCGRIGEFEFGIRVFWFYGCHWFGSVGVGRDNLRFKIQDSGFMC
jgi:hypothetical protein